MKKWIIPCNPNKYDIDGAFGSFSELEWSQGKAKIEVGDLVYIYVGKPVQAIRYLCEVIDTYIPAEKATHEDGTYSLTGLPIVADASYYMRIKLLREYASDLITFGDMKQRGVSGSIQSPRTVPEELELFIDNIESAEDQSVSLSNRIDLELLHKYARAFVFYEIAEDGVNPTETLEGTKLRKRGDEGYKYNEYDRGRALIDKSDTYTDAIIKAMPGYNLVDRFQKDKVVSIINEKGSSELEEALKLLFEYDEYEFAFESIIDVVGGLFDVLAFIFFLKDNTRFMPIRSRSFDKRFRLLGLDSQLEGNCRWDKYVQYNSWIKEVKDALSDSINKDITLLDAQSFLWILPMINDYLNGDAQIVNHKKFGKGVVIKDSDNDITVKFSIGEVKLDKKLIVENGVVTYEKLKLCEDKLTVDKEALKYDKEDDERIIKDLQEVPLPEKNLKFEYSGEAKTRPEPVYAGERKTYPRSKQISINALAHADYKCEIDNNHPTFIRRNSDKPYTEPHHLVPMALQEKFDVSLDIEENIVSLCSNCHNEIHYGRNAELLIKKLYEDRKDLLESVGIMISIDELKSVY